MVHHTPYTINNENKHHNTAIQQSALCHKGARLCVGSILQGLRVHHYMTGRFADWEYYNMDAAMAAAMAAAMKTVKELYS